MMSDSRGIILGALIALVGTFISGMITYATTKFHEKKVIESVKMELEMKKELELRTFEHNILMSNREYIPKATISILTSMNQLFVCTEMLVRNYPGTSFTGTHPDFIFSSTIDSLVVGFPNSRKQLNILSKDWLMAYKNFNNVVDENTIFLSSHIQKDLSVFEIYCRNIRDYFYARYSGIENEEDFVRKKEEYNVQRKDFSFFINNSGYSAPTHSVLDQYENLKESKKNAINSLSKYQKEKTEF